MSRFPRLITGLSAAGLCLALPAAELAAQGKCSFCELDPGDRGGANGNGNGNGNGKSCEANPGAENGNGKKNGHLKKQQNCDPVLLTIESELDFGRLVMIGTGQGRVLFDLDSGEKMVFGDLDDLGGMAVAGRAVITGKPRSVVRVGFPTIVTMNDPAGGSAQLRDFTTSLGPLPLLDADGRLEFKFTGTLFTADAIAGGGTLRGRVPITVDYN
ncbi:DUF4402 domain-containing protein [Alteripontixanthobacter maritimus]|nr:DUF4402 domain-containing protein [Alteripontixanthobacter maritimus]